MNSSYYVMLQYLKVKYSFMQKRKSWIDGWGEDKHTDAQVMEQIQQTVTCRVQAVGFHCTFLPTPLHFQNISQIS